MHVRAAAASAILTLTAACGHPLRHQPTRWREFVASASGVTFRAPADYRFRNEYGCWTRAFDRWGWSGWRDLCIDTLQTGMTYSFVRREDVRCIADCTNFDELTVDTVTLAGQPAVVERGRASGGMDGVSRERRLLVRLQARGGTVITLEGRMGDDSGYAELLAIAATMRLLRDSSASASALSSRGHR